MSEEDVVEGVSREDMALALGALGLEMQSGTCYVTTVLSIQEEEVDYSMHILTVCTGTIIIKIRAALLYSLIVRYCRALQIVSFLWILVPVPVPLQRYNSFIQKDYYSDSFINPNLTQQ